MKTVGAPSFFFFVHCPGSSLMCVSFQCCVNKLNCHVSSQSKNHDYEFSGRELVFSIRQVRSSPFFHLERLLFKLVRRKEERRKDQNTSGQRGNKFSISYRDISVVVAENNSVAKPKCWQCTSLNKMLSNFSKVLMAHISFTAVLNNGGIGKGIGGIRKGTKKNYIYVL